MIKLADKVKNTPLGHTHIFSLGQAGFIIKSKAGSLMAIDLYLSDCVERIEPNHLGYKRMLPKILSPRELTFDILICTHFHRDHYDVDSVPILMDNSKTTLYCPIDCKKDIDSESISNYCIIKPGITVKQGDFILHFVNCDHGKSAPNAVGVIVEVDGLIVLFIGDSCLRLDRKNEYLAYGEIDLLIAPINGKYGNLSVDDCYKLVDCINPKLFIPSHYGMFSDHGGDVSFLGEKFKETKHNYLIMKYGEGYIIK